MAARNLPPDWTELPDEKLLSLRMSDLPLRIEGTVLEGRIKQLLAELEARELRFPAHFYISSEWFTPDGTVSMAIPFYLAHPRLERLEKAQMLAVEGGDHDWCMRILRHEAGHVIDNQTARLKHARLISPSTLSPGVLRPCHTTELRQHSIRGTRKPTRRTLPRLAVLLTPSPTGGRYGVAANRSRDGTNGAGAAGRQPAVTSTRRSIPYGRWLLARIIIEGGAPV
jgi:hypothetical protein